jgi:hypothetical protein
MSGEGAVALLRALKKVVEAPEQQRDEEQSRAAWPWRSRIKISAQSPKVKEKFMLPVLYQ